MYIYNERLIQEFHMILTVAATSMYFKLILKSVRLAVMHILFISKFWKLILIGFVLGFTMVPMMEHELIEKGGGGGCLEISPFVEVWIIRTTFQAKLRKYRGVFKVMGTLWNVSSKSNVWMDPFQDWLHIWIQQNLIQCVFTNVLNYGTKYASW